MPIQSRLDVNIGVAAVDPRQVEVCVHVSIEGNLHLAPGAYLSDLSPQLNVVLLLDDKILLVLLFLII